jgi:hypothetical protein
MTAQLRVALPWLQAALEELAARPAPAPSLEALRWLAGRGECRVPTRRAWREWLLDGASDLGVDALRAWPAGPALARAGGFDDANACTWLLGQPAHLAAGLDHLRLAPLAQARLDEDEAAQLGSALRAYFPAAELEPVAWVDGAWLLRVPGRALDCVTQPPEAAVGRDVHGFMPAGPDGARVRSLMNEIQMLWHEHPVNERRARARQLPVNACWPWGFGAMPAAAPAAASGFARWRLQADDPWLRALWRLQGAGDAVQTGAAFEPAGGDTLLAQVEPPVEDAAAALEAVDAGLLSTLRDALRSGHIGRLEIFAGEFELRLDAAARLRFWRRPATLSRLLA